MVLTRIDSSRNVRRFYRMEIVPGLFGDWGLVREWGRIGRDGQVRTDWFASETDAKDACFKLHMEKAKRGYASSVRNLAKPRRFRPGVLALLSS